MKLPRHLDHATLEWATRYLLDRAEHHEHLSRKPDRTPDLAAEDDGAAEALNEVATEWELLLKERRLNRGAKP